MKMHCCNRSSVFGVFHTSHFFSTLSEHQRLGFCKWVQRVYQFASLQKPWRKGIALWPLFTNQNSLVTLRSLCTIFVQPFFSDPEVSIHSSGYDQHLEQCAWHIACPTPIFWNLSKGFGIFKGKNTLFSKSAQKLV